MKAEPVSRFLVVGRFRIHLNDYGNYQGRPILLIHGVLGSSWLWAGVAPVLADLGHVVCPDLRGYGESQWSAEGAYATLDHASDMTELSGLLGWHEVDVVGFGPGGLIGLAMAKQGNLNISHLAIIDGAPSSTKSPLDVPPVAMAVPSHEAAIESERRGAPRASDDLLGLIAGHGWRAGVGGQLVRKHDPVFADTWAFRGENWWKAIDSFQSSLLVVRGEYSQVLSPTVAADMAGRAPNGALVEINDCGHLVPLEQPEQLGKVLRGFLQ